MMQMATGTHGEKALQALDEKELLARAKANGYEAFEELVRRNQAKIYNLGLKLLGNREDAADLLQETFLKAYNALRQFQEKSAFATWLYRIATNLAFMKMRKRKLHMVRFAGVQDETGEPYQPEFPDWSENPKAHLENQELKTLLEKTIATLPCKYKTVFMLHDIEGFSTHEIGKMLDLSHAAVKSRVHRGRLFLRDRLAKYFHSGAHPGVN
jgi:RNA polymerase sigma-70 factor, ECF subfamily